jgi:hypothetical protein
MTVVPAALAMALVAAPFSGATAGAIAAPAVVRSANASVWHVSRSPKLRVKVAAGCPRRVPTDQDVVNTFPGPPLVPSSPTAGLVCRYYGSPRSGQLGRQTHLDAAQAGALVNVVRKLDLAPPATDAHCPMDNRAFAVVGFSYHGRADVGLWYSTSGCQTLDNGVIGAAEVGNPSFYVGFEATINKLSPPLPA